MIQILDKILAHKFNFRFYSQNTYFILKIHILFRDLSAVREVFDI